jgi:hypothetical protein
MRRVWTYSPSCSAPCTVGAISRHVSQKDRPLAHAMDQPASLSRQVRSSPVACRVLSSHNRFRNICWGAAKSLNMALAESALHPRPPKCLRPPPDAGAGTSASLPTPMSWVLWLRRQIFHGKCASLQTYLKCLHPPPFTCPVLVLFIFSLCNTPIARIADILISGQSSERAARSGAAGCYGGRSACFSISIVYHACANMRRCLRLINSSSSGHISHHRIKN